MTSIKIKANKIKHVPDCVNTVLRCRLIARPVPSQQPCLPGRPLALAALTSNPLLRDRTNIRLERDSKVKKGSDAGYQKLTASSAESPSLAAETPSSSCVLHPSSTVGGDGANVSGNIGPQKERGTSLTLPPSLQDSSCSFVRRRHLLLSSAVPPSSGGVGGGAITAVICERRQGIGGRERKHA